MHAAVSADRVHVTVTDSGVWKVPSSVPDPVRGRGVALMRLLMDDVTLDHGASGTTVHLTARIL